MKLASVASMKSEQFASAIGKTSNDVVEIGILLPANYAKDLIEMAKSRRESVGHMLRKLIDRELAAARRSG